MCIRDRKKWVTLFLLTVNVWLLLTSLKACDWSGHIFGASASPRFLTKKLAMSPSSTLHGGQHDTKHVTFELLMHAAFIRGRRNLGLYAWTSSYYCSKRLVRAFDRTARASGISCIYIRSICFVYTYVRVPGMICICMYVCICLLYTSPSPRD